MDRKPPHFGVVQRRCHNTGLICPIAVVQHETDNIKITFVCQSVRPSVCTSSYGRDFYSISIKFCTLIRGPERKTEFI